MAMFIYQFDLQFSYVYTLSNLLTRVARVHNLHNTNTHIMIKTIKTDNSESSGQMQAK